MTSKRKEKISAFLDDDMHRDELMSFSLSAESEDAKVAQRYQMLGDALRGEISDSSFIDVSSAVREALAGENLAAEHPADQISVADAKASTAASPVSASPVSGRFDLSGWLRPLAGMAVAASVAVVMVVTISEQGDSGIAPVASTVEQQPAAAMPVVRVASDAAIKNKASDQTADQYRQVNQDLVNQHLEFATQDALQGRLPYVRAVSFEQKNGFSSEK